MYSGKETGHKGRGLAHADLFAGAKRYIGKTVLPATRAQREVLLLLAEAAANNEVDAVRLGGGGAAEGNSRARSFGASADDRRTAPDQRRGGCCNREGLPGQGRERNQMRMGTLHPPETTLRH